MAVLLLIRLGLEWTTFFNSYENWQGWTTVVGQVKGKRETWLIVVISQFICAGSRQRKKLEHNVSSATQERRHC